MVVKNKRTKSTLPYNELPIEAKKFHDFVFSVAKNENEFAKNIGLERADSIYKITKYGSVPGEVTIKRVLKKYPEFNSNMLLSESDSNIKSAIEKTPTVAKDIAVIAQFQVIEEELSLLLEQSGLYPGLSQKQIALKLKEKRDLRIEQLGQVL